MGCWGFGILESDDALDEVCRYEDLAKLPGANRPQARRERLEQALPQLLGSIQPVTSSPGAAPEPDYDYAVSHQVLAAMLMEAGCAFPEETRIALIHGAMHCFEYVLATTADDAAKLEAGYGPDRVHRLTERQRAIDGLVTQLRAYDLAGGVRTQVPSQGLLDAIADRMNQDAQAQA